MASISVAEAAEIVDRFEELLASYGIDIPRHPQTGADMLPFWSILSKLKSNGLSAPTSQETDSFQAALAAHDLATKVLAVQNSPMFPRVLDHLKLLAKGTVHLTQEPPANADTYNKLIELYWACLLIGCGVGIQLDPPTRGSTGQNPDVITLDSLNNPMNGYAFKTIRSAHTESIREHLVKGVEQIQVSAAPAGIVALHLTPRLAWGSAWEADFVFRSYSHASQIAIDAMRSMLGKLITDNGQPAIDEIFRGKKASGQVLCIAFAPTLAISPDTGKPTFMPIKIATLIALASHAPVPHSLYLETWCANEIMQRQIRV